MKRTILISSLLLLAVAGKTQDDSTRVKKEVIKIEVDDDNMTITTEKTQTDSTGTIEESTSDTTRIRIGKWKIDIDEDKNYVKKEKDRDNKGDLAFWSGIDLGVNGYLTEDYEFDLGDKQEHLEIDYGRSRTISINFLQHRSRLIGDYVSIVTGMGVQWNNYRLDKDYDLSFPSDTIMAFLNEGKGVTKNKIRATYLTVPLLLTFNTSKKREKSFHLSAGVVGKLRIGSMYKQKYREDGNSFRHKTKGDIPFRPFQADAMVRVGYGWFTLFGTVGLEQLFKKDAGLEAYPVSAGIALVI